MATVPVATVTLRVAYDADAEGVSPSAEVLATVARGAVGEVLVELAAGLASVDAGFDVKVLSASYPTVPSLLGAAA
jgi:hypothetical protein